ncbi:MULTISPECIES: type II toxin-antitoxin system RelE/ParE family toxin [Rugamonas]|uniref:type II toxin-antitoxin system RelE/ParE family toxin n=1 Tax=Rugamonas TaxID=212744 RepID=UPI000B83E39B|nr:MULTISPECIES: type II toxin-antitoxin system RelE/ParE family toxin [Rugamonas]WGG49675.1 type II toxin-antitoxin system RelE/ParE family toxin [Rugamonas sp. DEMB1]
MPNGNGEPAKLVVRWLPRAQESFIQTIDHIARQDAGSAALIVERVRKAVAILAHQPGIGTPTVRAGTWRFPVPRTGHVIAYQVEKGELRIVRWSRQRRRRPA